MPRYCAAAYCTNSALKEGIALHSFPLKNLPILRKWVKFVQRKRANFSKPTLHTVLCSDHFVESDYNNLMQYRLGFTRVLKLKPTAVPSVQKTSAQALAAREARMETRDLSTPSRRERNLTKRNALKRLAQLSPAPSPTKTFACVQTEHIFVHDMCTQTEEGFIWSDSQQ